MIVQIAGSPNLKTSGSVSSTTSTPLRRKAAISRQKMALFQSLTLLDLVVYNKSNSSLQRISEQRCSEPYHSIPLNFKKSSIAIFLTELLSKTLREEEENKELFCFLHDSFQVLDHLENNFENFHIHFLVRLTKHLGFAVNSAGDIFREISSTIGDKSFIMDEESVLQKIIESNYSTTIKMSNLMRRDLLEIILQFYRIHNEGFGQLKSTKVLFEIMS